MKKFILPLLALLLVSCGGPTPTETPTITPTETPTVAPTETPTVTPTETPTEAPIEKTVTFAPIHLYEDLPTIEIHPLFSHESMKDEEHFTYTIADERVASIEGNVITYITFGRSLVYAKSENFETQFTVFTHEGFSTVGGPLANEYTNLRARYGNHQHKENATIFIGDSFFQFWRDGTAGALFSRDFEGENVVNLGINGTTTHHWRSILRYYMKDNVVSPKNIIVNIGINNVDDLSEDGKGAGRNVRTLLEELHEAFPDALIYYFSVTRCSSGHFATLWSKHDGVNTYLKENYFPNVTYATYLDANEIFGENYADYRMADGLHLNVRGYAVFKSLINEYVEIEELE